MEWLDSNRIKCTPPKNPKKMTGTRFASVLGLNKWSTPFEMWCEMTRTYEKPFEDTIYTIAGKTIEPKQAEYMKRAYFMPNLVTPTEEFGEDYFRKTGGNFFTDDIFGGMWDYLIKDKDGNPTTVLEMKTTKRVEDWEDDIPEYYALQAALYAWLLGVDSVVMVATMLEDGDYEHPEDFIPSASNTIVKPFKLSERYPTFEEDYIEPATEFYNKYVLKGISPAYDEIRDAEILKALRTKHIDISKVIDPIEELEKLKKAIDDNHKEIADTEKNYKAILDDLKKNTIKNFDDDVEKLVFCGSEYEWCLAKTETVEVDTEKMKADGIYEKYTKPKITYRMTCKGVD